MGVGTLTPPSHVEPLSPRRGIFSEPTYDLLGERSHSRSFPSPSAAPASASASGRGEGRGAAWAGHTCLRIL